MTPLDPERLYCRANEILEAMPEDGRSDADRIAESAWLARQELTQNGAGPDRPFAFSLEDFIAAKSDVPPALIGDADDNLLPVHGLMLIVAKGGKGKATIVTDQTFHLASGIDWLGFEVPRALRILFIENEGPREPFRHKLELKQEHWPHPIKGGIYIYDQDWGQARLNEEAFVDRLNGFVAEHEIDLVVGDPLDTFGMDGVGSPEDTRAMVERFQRAGFGSSVAWEVLHHSRKESVADAVDAVSAELLGDLHVAAADLDPHDPSLVGSRCRKCCASTCDCP
jgi:hypothetical protein